MEKWTQQQPLEIIQHNCTARSEEERFQMERKKKHHYRALFGTYSLGSSSQVENGKIAHLQLLIEIALSPM